MEEKKQDAQRQFEKTAQAYVTSTIHAQGSDLPDMVSLAELTGAERMLDIATGAGHVLFTFAPHLAEAVGLDLTPGMIRVAAAGVAERGLTNVRFVVGDVDHLPFDDASFDLVTCRIAAHHFPDLNRAMREIGRLLKPDGRCLVVDNYAPEERELDTFINTLEHVRDRSHVRAHPLSEWDQAFLQAGLSCSVARRFETPMGFDRWVERSQTPAPDVAVARLMLQQATPAAIERFAIVDEPELGFTLLKAILVGRKLTAAEIVRHA